MPLDTRVNDKLSIYQHATIKPSLQDLCADDPTLIPQVDEVLRELQAMKALAAPRPGDNATNDDDPPAAEEPLPARFGRFRILARLGEGGMGVVYQAEQDHPHRTVALKVISPGQLSHAALRRFEHEVEVL